ncbi:MAG: restriction endonuclease subunit S [Aureliella sp.]
MNTKTTLGRLAEIAIGYQHREKISHVEHGSHRLIQGKDLVWSDDLVDDTGNSAGWRIRTEELDQVTPKGDASRYRIQPGDLLFVSRGTTNVAVPLVEPFVKLAPFDWDNLIPAYVFYILRPDHERVLPEYLAWFINQPQAQEYLTRHSRGTLVKLLPKSVFEELEVLVPPLKIQQRIVELEHLRTREEFLLRKLTNARQRLIRQTCLEAINA